MKGKGSPYSLNHTTREWRHLHFHLGESAHTPVGGLLSVVVELQACLKQL